MERGRILRNGEREGVREKLRIGEIEREFERRGGSYFWWIPSAGEGLG